MRLVWDASFHMPRCRLYLPFQEALQNIGHELVPIKNRKNADIYKADASIIWRGNRLARELIEVLPRPRILIWTDDLGSDTTHRNYDYFRDKLDLYDLICPYWKGIFPVLQQLTNTPLWELPHGTSSFQYNPYHNNRVCFVGYDSIHRQKVLSKLHRASIPLDWKGRDKTTYVPFVEPYFQFIQPYLIHLNIHQNEHGFEQRVWDAMSVGKLCISEPMEHSEHLLQSGVHYISANTDDFVDVVKHYYEHPDEAMKIGVNSYRYGLQNTWEDRVRMLTKWVEAIKVGAAFKKGWGSLQIDSSST